MHENLIGKKYNSLTIVKIIKRERYYAECECECGKKVTPQLSGLKSGNNKSCGCKPGLVGKCNKTHGLSKTRSYASWCNMIDRCQNKNLKSYPRYGGRGIEICPEWHDFPSFYRDMGERPKTMTLDRIDNLKGYSRENCRWATRKTQQANREITVLLELNGETKPACEWHAMFGVTNYNVFKSRIRLGWDVYKALVTPLRLKS